MRKRIFQSFIFILLCSMMISLNLSRVYAASFSMSASQSTVDPGASFTVTVRLNGAGQFHFTASNGSVSESSGWADGSYTMTVKAGTSGSTTVTATAVDVTGYDETPITGSQSVTVKIKTPAKDPEPTPTPTPTPNTNTNTNSNTETPTEDPKVDTRSKVNTLSSLSISEGKMSPDFSEGTTSYIVNLTSETETLSISAKPKDSKATVSGTGEKDLVIGSQTFGVTVVAENGDKKVYSITVNVTEKPKVYTQMGDKKLGILTDLSKVKAPENYVSQTVSLENQDITGWSNEKTQLTLVYLMDEQGNKNFYIYEDGKIIRQYETIEIQGRTYVLLNIPEELNEQDGLVFSKIKLGDLEIDGWSFEDKNHANYSVVYLMNEAGEKCLYTYEGTEGTLQKYIAFEHEKVDQTMTYVFLGTTILFVLTTVGIYMIHYRFKRKSISAIKEYYDRKNNDLGD